jgi:DNA-binding MarR family transcriptional regulator
MAIRPGDPGIEEWRRLLRYLRESTTTLDADLVRDRHVSLEDYDVLVQLQEAGGALRMTDLGRAVLVTKSSCTRLVDRLVARGLVERRLSEADRRSVEVHIVKQGRALLRRAAVTHLRSIDAVFASRLDDRDLTDLHRILDHLAPQAPIGHTDMTAHQSLDLG